MSAHRFPYGILVMLLIGFCTPTQAATTARIVDTAPATKTTLGARQTFWIRIAYETDEPVSLWARPFRDGYGVQDAMTNASLPHIGRGEALAWFALNGPGSVDEVRVIAGAGNPYRTWEVATLPVDLRWTGSPPSDAGQPGWVADLLEMERVRYQEDAERRAAEDVSGSDMLLFNGFMVGVLALLLAGVVVPLRSVSRWQGGWRWAAAVPAVIMGFVVVRILIDTSLDPTSHNLWPFEILQAGILALAIIGALSLLRRWTGARLSRRSV